MIFAADIFVPALVTLAPALPIHLAAMGDADDEHRQHIILQRVNNPPITHAEPIAALAVQGFHIRRVARIFGKGTDGVQQATADHRIKRVNRFFRLAFILDRPVHSGTMPYRASSSSWLTPRGRPAASQAAMASAASLASNSSSMASSAS